MYAVDPQRDAGGTSGWLEALAWVMLGFAVLGTLAMVAVGSSTGLVMAVGLAVCAATLAAVGIFEYLIVRSEGSLA